jgi:hypothetical protein
MENLAFPKKGVNPFTSLHGRLPGYVHQNVQTHSGVVLTRQPQRTITNTGDIVWGMANHLTDLSSPEWNPPQRFNWTQARWRP